MNKRIGITCLVILVSACLLIGIIAVERCGCLSMGSKQSTTNNNSRSHSVKPPQVDELSH